MENREGKTKKKRLFSIFAILSLTLGVGLTLKDKTISETKAVEEIVLQTDFGNTQIYNWGSGNLTFPTQVPEGEITISKDRAALNNWDGNIVLVMAPITDQNISYIELPEIMGALSSFELKYRPWDGNAEHNIRDVLTTADLIVEKQVDAEWIQVASLDLRTEVNPNQFKLFTASLQGAGKYRLVYAVSGDVRGGDRDQALMIDDLVFYKDNEIGVSSVTNLEVSPTTKELVSNVALNSADYTVSVTKNGVPGSSNDYTARIGAGSGTEFLGTNIIWGTTRPKASDTTMQFKAKYPTTAGGSTYLTAEVEISVTEPEFGNIQFIELMQEPTKTQFYIGETFTSDGLVLRAYDDSNPQKTKEISEGYTTDFDGVNFGPESQGPKLVTVSYEENGRESQTWYQINVRQIPKKYTKITNVSQLHIGAHYLISGESNDDTYFMTTSQRSNARSGDIATFDGEKLVGAENAQVIQLVPGSVSGTYGLRSLEVMRGFLTASSSDNDYLPTLPDLSEDASWKITFEEEAFSIVAQGSKTHNRLMFNEDESNPLFSAYANEEGGVSLWRDESSVTTTPSVSISTVLNYTLYDGETVQFSAFAFNAGEATISWSVDNTSVATIDSETGLLTTLNEGVFTITASIVVEGETYTDEYWVYINESPYNKYTKVTSVADLRFGANYLIASSSGSEMYVISNLKTSNAQKAAAVTLKDGKIVENDDTQKFELRPGTKEGTYSFKTSGWDNNFLASASSSIDKLETVNYLSNDASWSINFSGETLSLVSNGSSRNNRIGFDLETEDGPVFSAYRDNESDISLWIDQNSVPNHQQISIMRRETTLIVGDTIQFSAYTLNLGETPITWSVSSTEVGSINDETGLFTALSPGHVDIRAQVIVDGQTYSDNVGVDVSLATYNHAGSEADPFTVRDARFKADATGTNETESEYYVQGVISDIVEIDVAKGYATFKLRDEGGYSDLLAYQVKWGEEGSDFTTLTAAKIVVGSEVTLVGKLYKYENNTRQLVQNSKVLTVKERDLVYEEVEAFVAWLMHEARDKEECRNKFMEAETKWVMLSADAKDLFKTHADFAEARARLLNWAIANGVNSLDEIGSGGKKTKNNVDKGSSLNATIIIGVIGLTTLAGYYFLKKRQTQTSQK